MISSEEIEENLQRAIQIILNESGITFNVNLDHVERFKKNEIVSIHLNVLPFSLEAIIYQIPSFVYELINVFNRIQQNLNKVVFWIKFDEFFSNLL